MNLLTETQLSEILKLSPRTLQTQRQSGRGIPYIKIGKSVRYDLDAVQAYLHEHNYRSTSELIGSSSREGNYNA